MVLAADSRATATYQYAAGLQLREPFLADHAENGHEGTSAFSFHASQAVHRETPYTEMGRNDFQPESEETTITTQSALVIHEGDIGPQNSVCSQLGKMLQCKGVNEDLPVSVRLTTRYGPLDLHFASNPRNEHALRTKDYVPIYVQRQAGSASCQSAPPLPETACLLLIRSTVQDSVARLGTDFAEAERRRGNRGDDDLDGLMDTQVHRKYTQFFQSKPLNRANLTQFFVKHLGCPSTQITTREQSGTFVDPGETSTKATQVRFM